MPAKYIRSMPEQSAERNAAQTLWRDLTSARRRENFTEIGIGTTAKIRTLGFGCGKIGNVPGETALQSEPEGFNDLSNVFGNLFRHGGLDDDVEIPCGTVRFLSFSFYAESGSGLRIRRNLESELFSGKGLDGDFGSEQKIEERDRTRDGGVKRFAGCFGSFFGSGTSARLAHACEKVREIEGFRTAPAGRSRGASRKAPNEVFETGKPGSSGKSFESGKTPSAESRG